MLGNELKNPSSQNCTQFSVYLTLMVVAVSRASEEGGGVAKEEGEGEGRQHGGCC